MLHFSATRDGIAIGVLRRNVQVEPTRQSDSWRKPAASLATRCAADARKDSRGTVNNPITEQREGPRQAASMAVLDRFATVHSFGLTVPNRLKHRIQGDLAQFYCRDGLQDCESIATGCAEN